MICCREGERKAMNSKSMKNANPMLPYKGGLMQFESRPVTIENGIVSNKMSKEEFIKRMMADKK